MIGQFHAHRKPDDIYLKDYTAPAYQVEDVNLTFRIFSGKTTVAARTRFKKSIPGAPDLVLNGERLKLLSVKINGADAQYTVDEKFLTLPCPGDSFTLKDQWKINGVGSMGSDSIETTLIL